MAYFVSITIMANDYTIPDESYLQQQMELEHQEYELYMHEQNEHQQYLEVLAKGDEHGNY
jgi:hypothetical protein